MRGLVALLLLVMASALGAEVPVVVSPGAEDVGVTIYRNNRRSAHDYVYDWEDWNDPPSEWDDNGPRGFAVIDEIRTIDLPPGQVTVRFEGVAGGIVPASAILFGSDLKEKNFDARLLSERGLVDAFTGQAVTIRRTDPNSGTVQVERGTIVSQPDRLILRSSSGYEAIRCEGNITDLLFPGMPVDLTARPTLSMTTRPDQPGGRMVVHLAYLADNFDWEATYVGMFSPDAGTLTLSGWLTLQSADPTSFVDADTSAVAGEVFRAYPTWEEREELEEAAEDDPYAPENIALGANCWSATRTGGQDHFLPGKLPVLTLTIEPLDRLAQFGCDENDDECDAPIVVTGSRIQPPATIGDLKFYRIPHRTTVAAQSQKQIRFLGETKVEGELLFLASVYGSYTDDGQMIYRFTNDKDSGLGVPLPIGGVTLFQETRFGPQLIGPSAFGDKAEGEKIELGIGEEAWDSGVNFEVDQIEIAADRTWTRHELTVENENDYPVTVEVEFVGHRDEAISDISRGTFRRDGVQVWRVEVPPESERKLRYTSTELPEIDW